MSSLLSWDGVLHDRNANSRNMPFLSRVWTVMLKMLRYHMILIGFSDFDLFADSAEIQECHGISANNF